jgi:hypothetical protein
MIAADTSTWVSYLEGGEGHDVQMLGEALEARQVAMVPVVLTELLSDPKIPSDVADTLSEIPLIEIESGFWRRTGALRAIVLSKRRKARLGDALIANAALTVAFHFLRATVTSVPLHKRQVSTLSSALAAIDAT